MKLKTVEIPGLSEFILEGGVEVVPVKPDGPMAKVTRAFAGHLDNKKVVDELLERLADGIEAGKENMPLYDKGGLVSHAEYAGRGTWNIFLRTKHGYGVAASRRASRRIASRSPIDAILDVTTPGPDSLRGLLTTIKNETLGGHPGPEFLAFEKDLYSAFSSLSPEFIDAVMDIPGVKFTGFPASVQDLRGSLVNQMFQYSDKVLRGDERWEDRWSEKLSKARKGPKSMWWEAVGRLLNAYRKPKGPQALNEVGKAMNAAGYRPEFLF